MSEVLVSLILSSKYSSGNRSVVPYTSSAVVQCRSFFSVVWMPSKIKGSKSVYMMGLWHALMDDFIWRWNCSTIPLAIGWCNVVLIPLQPSSSINHCHSADSNWHPRSVVMEDGTPNRDIQQLMKACATVSAVMSAIGMASRHVESVNTS